VGILGGFLILSSVVLVCSILLLLKKERRIFKVLTGYQIFVVGLVLAACLFYVPYCVNLFKNESGIIMLGKTLLLSVHHAISLFVVALNYEEVYSFAIEKGIVGILYSYYGAFLFVTAPLTTFGFILSFTHNLNAYRKIFFSRRRSIYVFSELNENSVYLAKDMYNREKKAVIIFMNIEENNKIALTEEIKRIHAICIKKDIVSFNSAIKWMKRKVVYMLFSENEGKNIYDVFHLLKEESGKIKRDIYVYLNDYNNPLAGLPDIEGTRVFRFENAYALILGLLDGLGMRLLESAVPNEKREKIITALVIGMDSFGEEMIKGLAWYTQISGYRTRIFAFDEDQAAGDKFRHKYPGFFCPEPIGKCRIDICGGYEFGTHTLDEEIDEIENTGYIFISLGSDDANINAAFDVRSLYARKGEFPIIQTIVKDSYRRKMLQQKMLSDKEPGNLEFIDYFENLFSYDAVFATKNRQDAIFLRTWWMSDEEKKAKTESLLADEEKYREFESEAVFDRLYLQTNAAKIIMDVSRTRYSANYMYGKGYIYGKEESSIAKTSPTLESVTWDKITSDILLDEFIKK